MLDHNPLMMGPAPAEAGAVAILMHGRGGSPEDMAGLAAAFGLPDVAFILPRAPGGQWYPNRFTAPIAANEPYLTQALDAYERIVAGLVASGIPASRIAVGGFSQGACLTSEFLVRHPRPYGAAVILTGGLIGPPGTVWQPQAALAGVPVYLSGSRVDEWVPVERADETARILRASGAALTYRIFDDRPHTVSREEVAAARDILAAVANQKQAAGNG